MSSSIPKSSRCSASCGDGVFGVRVQLRKTQSDFGVRSPGSGLAKEEIVARKTVLVCDNCSTEVGDNRGATMRLTYSDARRGAKQADLCDDCAANLPGQPVARRGRRPKSAAAA